MAEAGAGVYWSRGSILLRAGASATGLCRAVGDWLGAGEVWRGAGRTVIVGNTVSCVGQAMGVSALGLWCEKGCGCGAARVW